MLLKILSKRRLVEHFGIKLDTHHLELVRKNVEIQRAVHLYITVNLVDTTEPETREYIQTLKLEGI